MGFGDNVIVTNLGAGTYSGASSLTGEIAQMGNVPGGVLYGAEKLMIIAKIGAISTGGNILIDTSIDGVNWTSGGFVGKIPVNAANTNYPITWVNVPLSYLLFSYSFGASTDSFVINGIDLMGTNT